MLQEMVGVLSGQELGKAMRASEAAARRVASLRMRAVRSSLELVSFTPGLVSMTKLSMIYGGQVRGHTILQT